MYIYIYIYMILCMCVYVCVYIYIYMYPIVSSNRIIALHLEAPGAAVADGL